MDYVIKHHGIKGQHWGVRRFQNEDGSLTEAGKKRYNTLDFKNRKYENKIEKSREKADKYKGRVKSHYLTDFGKHKSEKNMQRASVEESKIAKYKKKIEKNKRLMELMNTKVADLYNG